VTYLTDIHLLGAAQLTSEMVISCVLPQTLEGGDALAWMYGFRRGYHMENFLSFVHLACLHISLRNIGECI